jgi:hypothetical protein
LARAALGIQNPKKTAGNSHITIKKVFFTDNDDEISTLSKYLDEQKQNGVDIHYIPRDKIPPYRPEDIHSIDFGIIDNEVVLVWKLDGRTHVGGTILYGEEHVQKYTNFFNNLFSTAADYNRDRIIVIELGKETRDIIRSWPRYPAPYEDMNYAIHSMKEGWLVTYGSKPTSKSFAA